MSNPHHDPNNPWPTADPSQPHHNPLVPFNEPPTTPISYPHANQLAQPPQMWQRQPSQPNNLVRPDSGPYYQPQQHVMPNTQNAVCFLEDVKGNITPNPNPCNNPNYHVHAVQIISKGQQAGFAQLREDHTILRATVRDTVVGQGLRFTAFAVIVVLIITQIERGREWILSQPSLTAQPREFITNFDTRIIVWILLALLAINLITKIIRIIQDASTYVEIRKLDSAFLLYRPYNWMVWQTNVNTVQFGQLSDCSIIRRNALLGTMRVRLNGYFNINLTKEDGEFLYSLASAILIQNQNTNGQIRTFRV